MFRPSKSLGQNFLVNKGIVKKIIAAAELSKNDTVLEIGPGKGVLTEELIKRAGHVVAVEKDRQLYEMLLDKFNNVKNLELYNLDISRFTFHVSRFKVVANIPYNISGRIFRKFLTPPPNPPLDKEDEGGGRPEMLVIMVQKEVGEKLLGRKGRSMLTLLCELYGTAEKICDVSPGSFFPAPAVESSVIKLTSHGCHPERPTNLAGNRRIPWEMQAQILQIAKIGFSSKRKKLASNLSTGLKIGKNFIEKIFGDIGLNKNARAEELSKDDWLNLSRTFSKNFAKYSQ